ncbi:MAG: tetratricopeptide repeat protein [Nitrospiria bacterium]
MPNLPHIRSIFVWILGIGLLLSFFVWKEQSATKVGHSKTVKEESPLLRDRQFPLPSRSGPSIMTGVPSRDNPEWVLLNRQGLQQFNQGNHQAALALFLEALALNPEDGVLRKNVSQAHAQLGWEAVRAGRFTEAIPRFEEAIEGAPREASYYIGKGLALHRIERGHEAIETVGIGLRLNPMDAAVYKIGGEIYYDRNEYEKAMTAWEKAIQLDPGDHTLLDRLEKMRREHRLFSRFQRQGTSHFTLLFEGREDRSRVRPVLRFLESAYQEIGRALSYYPKRTVLAVLYTDKEFRDVTKSPAWTKALFDGKIHLPVGGDLQDEFLLKKLIYHEYTHALVYELSRGKTPTWLNEGLALYFEEGEGLGGTRAESNPKRVLRSFISLEKLHGSFMSFDERTAEQAYRESGAATAYLIERYGFFRVKLLLERLAAAVPFSDAFDETLLISYADFQRDWQKKIAEGR